jgi:hypothetical protein
MERASKKFYNFSMKTKIRRSEFQGEKCPRCGLHDLKTWDDLDDQDKIVARSFYSSLSEEILQQYFVCTFCWFKEPISEHLNKA